MRTSHRPAGTARRPRDRVAGVLLAAVLAGGPAACSDPGGAVTTDGLEEDLRVAQERIEALDERVDALEDRVAGEATEVPPTPPATPPVTPPAPAPGPADPSAGPGRPPAPDGVVEDEAGVLTDPADLAGEDVTVRAPVTELVSTTSVGGAFRIGAEPGATIAVVTPTPPAGIEVGDVVRVTGTVAPVRRASFEADFGIAADALFEDPAGVGRLATDGVAVAADRVEVTGAG